MKVEAEEKNKELQEKECKDKNIENIQFKETNDNVTNNSTEMTNEQNSNSKCEVTTNSNILRKILILIIVILMIAILFLGAILYDNNLLYLVFKRKVNITNLQNIEYEIYTNNDFSMKIPKGWKVEYSGGLEYGIRVYDPNNEIYSMHSFYAIGGFNKSEVTQQMYEKYATVWNNGYEKYPVLNPATPENYYKNWNSIMSFAKSSVLASDEITVPDISEFSIIEQYELNSNAAEQLGESATLNEAILRADFVNSKTNQNGEGVFSVSIIDILPNNSSYPLTSYNITGITTANGDMINWQNSLTECLDSIEFNEKHIEEMNIQIDSSAMIKVKYNEENDKICSAYTNGWTSRNIEYDIKEQKSKDETNGDIRLVDATTGKIYIAKKEWYEEYKTNSQIYANNNLKLIDDTMYAKPIAGEIL